MVFSIEYTHDLYILFLAVCVAAAFAWALCRIFNIGKINNEKVKLYDRLFETEAKAVEREAVINGLEKEIEVKTSRVKTLSGQNQKICKTNDLLNDRVAALQTKIWGYRAERDSLKEQNAKLNKNYLILRTALQKFQNKYNKREVA